MDLLLSILLIGACCRDEARLPGLAETVMQKIESQDATPIPLAQATEFPWDRVFVFAPYTPYEEVLREVGTRWECVLRTGIATREGPVI